MCLCSNFVIYYSQYSGCIWAIRCSSSEPFVSSSCPPSSDHRLLVGQVSKLPCLLGERDGERERDGRGHIAVDSSPVVAASAIPLAAVAPIFSAKKLIKTMFASPRVRFQASAHRFLLPIIPGGCELLSTGMSGRYVRPVMKLRQFQTPPSQLDVIRVLQVGYVAGSCCISVLFRCFMEEEEETGNSYGLWLGLR